MTTHTTLHYQALRERWLFKQRPHIFGKHTILDRKFKWLLWKHPLIADQMALERGWWD